MVTTPGKPKVGTGLEQLAAKEREAWEALSKKDQEKLSREAYRIHCNTTHRPPAILAEGLRLAKARPQSVAAMKLLHCDGCAETRGPAPAPPTSFHEDQLPWVAIGIDFKEDVDESQDAKTKYMAIIDEVTRLTRMIELFTVPVAQARNATTEEVVKAYDNGWR